MTHDHDIHDDGEAHPLDAVIRRPYEFDSRLEWERCGICLGSGFPPGGYGMGNCAGCNGKGWILKERAP